jgi:hypothetical protein
MGFYLFIKLKHFQTASEFNLLEGFIDKKDIVADHYDDDPRWMYVFNFKKKCIIKNIFYIVKNLKRINESYKYNEEIKERNFEAKRRK